MNPIFKHNKPEIKAKLLLNGLGSLAGFARAHDFRESTVRYAVNAYAGKRKNPKGFIVNTILTQLKKDISKWKNLFC